MSYAIKEMYLTVQGEGGQAGRAALFCRFAGCNLWTGRDADRHRAVCRFCDTDFVGVGPDGGRFATADALADAVRARWPADAPAAVRPFVVCTGGEPLLQLDAGAVDALHRRGFEVAVETNGTQLAPPGLDWVCVSPKAGAPLRLTSGDELKLVYPQAEPEAQPERYAGLAFRRFSLQPLDAGDPAATAAHARRAVEYCLRHPQWRLSVQTHKVLDIR